MKRIAIFITIVLIAFLIIFLNINSKENKIGKIEKNNISIILETEEGNLESSSFPSKEDYNYSNVVCENTNNEITPTFNEETWKLSLNVENKEIDGNFNCIVYFKEKEKIPAVELIISKYTENNNEGLIKINQPETEQTEAGTEYRYSGSNDDVKNYVNFNNELWRIIGVFPTDDGTGNIENRVKIIRNEKIGNYSWDTSPPGINDYIDSSGTAIGPGINQWGESGNYKGADLMRLLNSGYENESINNSLYWNRESGACYSGTGNSTTACDFTSTGLTSEGKQMIEDAKWYLGAVDQRGITTLDAYTQERGNVTGIADTGISVTKTTNWVGKVALPYPSDYGYASKECYEGVLLLGVDDDECITDYAQEKCKNTNWMFTGNYQDLLNPTRKSNVGVRGVFPEGVIGNGLASNIREDTRPSVYLSSLVKIKDGDGTLSDPYDLSL